jgi:hypothetical protein
MTYNCDPHGRVTDNRSATYTGPALMLQLNLECAVPIWIRHVRRMDDRTRYLRQQTCADYVGTHGDDLQYGGKYCTEAFNRLAEGLALCAFSPGGVSAFGLHWEATECGAKGPKPDTWCTLEPGHRGDWHDDGHLTGWLATKQEER